jgi:long-chain acyl-CoA synthetase
VRGERRWKKKKNLEISRPREHEQLWDLSRSSPAPTVVLPGDTIPAMFWNAVQQRGPNVWMRQKQLGIWRSWTWSQTAEAVREIAGGLMSLGFKPRRTRLHPVQHRGRMGAGRPGRAVCGGVSNGIYPTDAASRCSTCARTRAPRCCSWKTTSSWTRRWKCASSCRAAQDRGVRHGRPARAGRPGVISLDACASWARLPAQHPDADAARQACKPEDLAILVYTSGTTGKPKGAMHSHQAWSTPCAATTRWWRRTRRDERMCFLPLCHIAERMGGEYFALYTGAKLNFVENPETIPENVREIAPTVFTAVPRVWEKFYSGVMIALKEAGRCSRPPTPGASAWAPDCRQGAGRPAGGGWLKLSSRWPAGWR